MDVTTSQSLTQIQIETEELLYSSVLTLIFPIIKQITGNAEKSTTDSDIKVNSFPSKDYHLVISPKFIRIYPSVSIAKIKDSDLSSRISQVRACLMHLRNEYLNTFTIIERTSGKVFFNLENINCCVELKNRGGNNTYTLFDLVSLSDKYLFIIHKLEDIRRMGK